MLRHAAFAAALLAAAPATAEDHLKIAIGQRGLWDTSPSAFGERQGFFKEQGLTLELLYTAGGGETQQAVISGGTDIGIGVGILGIVSAAAKGAPVKIISSGYTGSSDLFWYARADTGIRSFKDAEGKTAAYSTAGASTQLVVLGLIAQAGVKAKPTATGSPPGTLTQVMSGQIDIGWSAPPIGFNELDAGRIRIVGRGSDLPEIASQTVRVLIANSEMLAKRRDAVRRYMAAYAKTIEWMYQDPKALEYFAEMNAATPEQARRARDEFYPKAAMRLGPVQDLERTVKEAIELKRLPGPLNKAQTERMMDILAPPPG
jgi:NitT/TauT family transport system substrate-binding protein